MKIKILALAVAVLPVQLLHAAEVYNRDSNKLDLYGQVAARHYFSDNRGIDGDNSFVRLGFKGETQIADGLTGYGQWEYNFQANNSEGSDAQNGNKTRLGFAGIKFADWGSVDYGRNYGVIFDVAAITDTPVIFDDQTFSASDNFLTGRGNGMLTYRNNNFFGLVDGLKFALQYQGANSESTNNPRTATRSNGDGYGASASWDVGYNLTLLTAYATSKRTNQQKQLSLGEGDRADVWSSGIKYDDSHLYFATTYARTNNLTPVRNLGYANKTTNVEIVAKYVFDTGLAPQIGYFRSSAKDLNNYGDQDLLNYWDFSVAYYLNKNISVYADYKLNRINKDNNLGLASDDQTGVGLTYQF